MNKTIAVIGAGGQVGSALCEYLAGYPALSVVAILRGRYLAPPLQAQTNCVVRIGDLSRPEDRDGVTKLLDGCDAVINCALPVGLPHQRIIDSANLFKSIKHAAQSNSRIKTVVHLSSVAVYGMLVYSRLGVSFERPNADNEYARFKLKTEALADQVLGDNNQLKLYILRLGHVYGVGQAHSRNFFSLLKESGFALPNAGDNLSNVVHIDDLCEALLTICTGDPCKSGTFNVIEAPNPPWKSVFEMHAQACESDSVRTLNHSDTEKLIEFYVGLYGRSRLRAAFGEICGRMLRAGKETAFGSEALRDLGQQLLRLMPHGFEKRVKSGYDKVAARTRISTGAHGGVPLQIPPHFCWQPVPGPNLMDLVATDSLRQTAKRVADLARWYQLWAEPRWERYAQNDLH